MLDALAEDPYGIAYAAIQYGRKNARVKPAAIAAGDRGPYIQPTRENFENRTYPLHEAICIYINRAPGNPLDKRLKEFLLYVLSRQGQVDVVEGGGGYLPLTAEEARAQVEKLN